MNGTGAFVLGLGVSGRTAAELLLAQGKRVIAADQKAELLKKEPAIERLIDLGLCVKSEGEAIDWQSLELVILSPGIAPTHPLVEKAKSQGIETIGEIEFAFRSLQNPCVGITGTNGKTTTALLATHILQQTGRKARALGNIGTSLSSYVLKADPEEILVVELSSFQLESLKVRRLDAAVFLNLTPDHLDRYSSMEEYAKAKARIGECLKPGKNLWVSEDVQTHYGSMILGSRNFEEEFKRMPWETEAVAPISQMRYIQLGLPERQNVLAAYALCKDLGVSDSDFSSALSTFRKPRHRIEYLGDWNGIGFYNDSKATNIDAAMHAIALFDGSIVLLAGGVDKGASYLPWVEAFQGKVVQIVAFGQAGSKIESELKHAFFIERVKTLEEAVILAALSAKAGMSVLLSPGCSSFDEFRNYEHRGNEFKRMVEEKVWIEKKRS